MKNKNLKYYTLKEKLIRFFICGILGHKLTTEVLSRYEQVYHVCKRCPVRYVLRPKRIECRMI